ncbi:CAMK family protein kinase [Histomonas meleagridis]|uniref:CAMK family protein kinase n=1 Tax=Histomonas meleagridis TaxID=135588 RepID=UPI003559DB5A|nr:CAMK family protein kinase [Histomonas meleagridis]KAH0803499.1 CAMK family protein kinase [Histomonas meleagridis]
MFGGTEGFIGKPIKINSYNLTIKEKIGEGGYANVYRCVDQNNNEFALKTINCTTPNRFLQFKQEVTFLTSIQPHPNIVKLYASEVNENNLTINILFEFCPATAIGIMSKRFLTREEIIIFFNGIVKAVSYLHSQNPPIIHRDIKPENLLVGLDGLPKLCDFGSATTQIYDTTKTSQHNMIKDDISQNTTENYRSPEMIDLYKFVPIDIKSDIWALGCTLYKLIYRNDIFNPGESLPILQGRINLPPGLDPDFARIIRACLKVNASERPTASQVLDMIFPLTGGLERINFVQEPITQPPHVQSNLTKTDDVGVFCKFKEKYRSIMASGVPKWVIKATYASTDPPKSKYVRRVILAVTRHTQSTTQILKFLLTERDWRGDYRIAAKTLYLVLLICQFEENPGSISTFMHQIDEVRNYFKKQSIWVSLIKALGTVLRSKLDIHVKYPDLEGNFACKSQIIPAMCDAAKVHLNTVNRCVEPVINRAIETDDFSLLVMLQPLVDEVANAYKFVRILKPNDEECEKAQEILGIAKKATFLESAVEYPIDTKPMPRFNINE